MFFKCWLGQNFWQRYICTTTQNLSLDICNLGSFCLYNFRIICSVDYNNNAIAIFSSWGSKCWDWATQSQCSEKFIKFEQTAIALYYSWIRMYIDQIITYLMVYLVLVHVYLSEWRNYFRCKSEDLTFLRHPVFKHTSDTLRKNVSTSITPCMVYVWPRPR